MIPIQNQSQREEDTKSESEGSNDERDAKADRWQFDLDVFDEFVKKMDQSQYQ